jgi:general secretion pathway protein B
MSYILDALCRAETERQRGQIPGLDSQAQAAPAPDGEMRRRIGAPVMIGAVLLLGLSLLALAVMLLRSPAPARVDAGPATPVVPAAGARPSLAAAAPASAAAPAPPLPVVVSLPRPAVVATVAVTARPAAVVAPATPTVTAPGASPAPPLPLSALSAEQRRGLPALSVGGSIWSESAAQRFVVLNGQVVHEGEVAAPGLTVERITMRSVVLRWRELRLELPL